MTYERYENGVKASNGSPSSREIQSDVSEIREEMSKTLGEITAKLAPKEVLSQLLGTLTDGGESRLLKTLSRSFARNPVPIAMIAGGVGYLVYQELQSRHAATEGGESAASGARELTSTAREHADALAGRAREGARDIAQRASTLASQAAHATRSAAEKGQEMIREQPLVLAGLGIALGAALGGATPLSRPEKELIGEPAGQLMGELQQRANQIKDRVGEGVRAAGEAAKQALSEPSTTAGPDESDPGSREQSDRS